MAVLTANEFTELRQHMVRLRPYCHWVKADVNAALQAIEDRMMLSSTKTALSSDIEAAVPGEFTAQEKLDLFGIWCITAAKRLGVI